MDKIAEFIDGVKEGTIRGDYRTHQLYENLLVEVSVSDFQYGSVHVRVWVEETEIEPTEGLNFRTLRSVDSVYAEAQETIEELLENKNETEVSIFFEPEMRYPKRAEKNTEMVPDQLSVNDTYCFDQMVQLRDDVSMAEAMMTNREDSMTRTEVEEFLEEENNS